MLQHGARRTLVCAARSSEFMAAVVGGRRLASTVFDRWTKVLPPTRVRTTTKRSKAIVSLAVIGRPLGAPKRAFVAGDRNGKGCPLCGPCPKLKPDQGWRLNS